MRVTKKLEEKIQKCKSVYLVVKYASWCVREFKWTGKWEIGVSGCPYPIVWLYDDHNGRYEEYVKTNILLTTTGTCYDWTFYKKSAEYLKEKLNADNV